MIGKSALRAIALAATLGQLLPLPAAVACAMHHARPVAASHCGDTAPLTSGPAASAAHDAGQAPCAGMPCTLQSPSAIVAGFRAAPQSAASGAMPTTASSVTSVTFSPPSPPPQA